MRAGNCKTSIRGGCITGIGAIAFKEIADTAAAARFEPFTDRGFATEVPAGGAGIAWRLALGFANAGTSHIHAVTTAATCANGS